MRRTFYALLFTICLYISIMRHRRPPYLDRLLMGLIVVAIAALVYGVRWLLGWL